MANLYSYQGQEPQELPERIRLSDGRTRTDPSSFTAEEIKDAGFTGPYERPEYNSEIETQEWSSELSDWVTTPIPAIPDEVFWERLRNERNLKLTNSDWSQLPDAPLTTAKKTAWATYRQALRDLPENTEDPKNVTWPSQPE
jgi:hypothetical protein